MTSEVKGRNRGSAVVLVLISLTVLAALSISLRQHASSSVQMAATAVARVQSDLRTDTALSEMLAAYLGSNTEFRDKLIPDGRALNAEINDQQFVVSAATESGKIDLRFGNRELIDGLLSAAFHGEIPDEIIKQLDLVQRDKDAIGARLLIRALSEHRFAEGTAAADLFTVYTRQSKLDPTTANPLVKNLTKRLRLSPQSIWGQARPIYTLSAAWIDGAVERPGRSITVLIRDGKSYEILGRESLTRKLLP